MNNKNKHNKNKNKKNNNEEEYAEITEEVVKQAMTQIARENGILFEPDEDGNIDINKLSKEDYLKFFKEMCRTFDIVDIEEGKEGSIVPIFLDDIMKNNKQQN